MLPKGIFNSRAIYFHRSMKRGTQFFSLGKSNDRISDEKQTASK
jgi:hypothetical protein